MTLAEAREALERIDTQAGYPEGDFRHGFLRTGAVHQEDREKRLMALVNTAVADAFDQAARFADDPDVGRHGISAHLRILAGRLR